MSRRYKKNKAEGPLTYLEWDNHSKGDKYKIYRVEVLNSLSDSTKEIA